MQEWSKLPSQEGRPCPVGRYRHAAVCLGYGGQRPQLLIIGGRDSEAKVLDDMWLLDVHSSQWKEVS